MLLALLFASTLTLNQAWEQAAHTNPTILETREYMREMDYAIEEARAQIFPKIDTQAVHSGNLNPGFLNSKDFEKILEEFPFEYQPEANYLYDLSLTLSQDLYTGGSIRTGLQAAQLAREVALTRARRASNEVYRDIAEAYTNLFLARESRRVHETNLEQQKVFLDQVRLRYDVGDATQLELLQARVALSSVYPELYHDDEQIALHEGKLRELLGEDPEFNPVLEELPHLEIRPAIEDLIPYALEHHPDVLELKQAIEETELREYLAASEAKPQASVRGGYGYSVSDLSNLGDPLYKAWNFEVRISLSLFDGFDRKYRKLQQASRRDQLAYRLEASKIRIDTTLTSLIKRLKALEEQLDANQTFHQQAQEALRTAEENFSLGAVTQLEVLDAQRQERQAQLSVLQSRFNVFMTRVTLLFEAGVPLYEE
ncbi:MAG TPA: TolC family protein [Thermoanaerobaculia bacterium]|nr:TolC family protein [Thermoanaerobaculia bacterium]HUM29628.1 TolC family protein [Thermoanaerobaculia bacterium]HXK67279.1 TolC family protein [Thermoanaerobaculia bacterium]